jgi:hypothetical protein
MITTTCRIFALPAAGGGSEQEEGDRDPDPPQAASRRAAPDRSGLLRAEILVHDFITP